MAEQAWPILEAYAPQRYFVLPHGVGMTGEYSYLFHKQDIEANGYEGVVQAGMTLCAESSAGAASGAQGLKLEHQVLVTASGVELLSRFPVEEELRGREL